MTASSAKRSVLRFPVWLPAPNPFSLVTIVFVLCLFIAPTIWFPFDVESCWLPWSRASDGIAPWRIYATRSDCNYPPLILYLLTVQEALRRVLQAEEVGTISLLLTKIPNIIAHLAGAVTGYFLLRGVQGEKYARRFALLYALSLPLFVNATLWGQADALLTLPMLCAVLLLMRGRPVPAGVALGVALSIKLQAIVIAPVLLLYAWKQFGWQKMVQATLAGLAILFVISLPFFIAGTTKPMINAYTGAANYYKLRTLNTFNIWGYFNYIDEYIRHIPGEIVNADDRRALGPLTYRDVSVSLFLVVLMYLLSCVWRRTTPRVLAWSAGLSVWAFVTLCTQMHERYWVPGAALLLVVAPESWLALSLGLLTGFTAAWNQWLVLVSNFMQYHPVPEWVKWSLDAGWAPSLMYISVLNVVLLITGMIAIGLITAKEPEKESTTVEGDEESTV